MDLKNICSIVSADGEQLGDWPCAVVRLYEKATHKVSLKNINEKIRPGDRMVFPGFVFHVMDLNGSWAYGILDV